MKDLFGVLRTHIDKTKTKLDDTITESSIGATLRSKGAKLGSMLKLRKKDACEDCPEDLNFPRQQELFRAAEADEERIQILHRMLPLSASFDQLTWVYKRAKMLKQEELAKAASKKRTKTGVCKDWLDICRRDDVGDKPWFTYLRRALERNPTPEDLGFIFVEIYQGMRLRPMVIKSEKAQAELREHKERVRMDITVAMRQKSMPMKRLAGLVGWDWVTIILYEECKAPPALVKKLPVDMARSVFKLSPEGSVLSQAAYKQLLTLSNEPEDMLMLFEKRPKKQSMREQLKSIIVRKAPLSAWETFIEGAELTSQQWALVLELLTAHGKSMDHLMRLRNLLKQAPSGTPGLKKFTAFINSRIAKAVKGAA